MDETAAWAMAHRLIEEHGLDGWGFRFDRATRRFGACRHGEKMISLSRSLTRHNDEGQVRDTLLHEIAHALVGPGQGHGATWRAMARRVGARPERCYDGATVAKVPARWVGICPCCRVRVERMRLAARTMACTDCCKVHNGGRWWNGAAIEWYRAA